MAAFYASRAMPRPIPMVARVNDEGEITTLNALYDFHHQDLARSLLYLLENRLGWGLFRQIGLSWFEEGYWDIARVYGNNPDTIRQYLDINTRPYEPFKNLNGDWTLNDGIYHIYDQSTGMHQKAITL